MKFQLDDLREDASWPIKGWIIADYRQDKNVERARAYLGTLSYRELVTEARRTHDLIREGSDSVLDSRIPDQKHARLEWTMKPSEYLPLIHQAISQQLRRT